MEGSKSFGTQITKKHLGTLSALFFGRAWEKMGQKCQYLAKNASFGPKVLIFMGVSKSFGTNIAENHLGNLFPLFVVTKRVQPDLK